MGAYRYCDKCDAPRDQVTIDEIAFTDLRCQCGEPLRVDQAERYAAVAAMRDGFEERIARLEKMHGDDWK